MTPFDKKRALSLVRASLEKQFQLLVEAASEAKAYSTDEESKAENKYDTRGLEASYLASGQSKRAMAIQEQIFNLDKVVLKTFSELESIGMSAIVELAFGDHRSRFLFLLPVGGVEIALNGQKIQSITVESPLGKLIFGQKVGFEFLFNNTEYEVLSVQ